MTLLLDSAVARERFEKYAVKGSDAEDCWSWTAYHNRLGYGQLMVDTPAGHRPIGAHRVAYELFVGSIPEGLVLDHLCRNPGCCNPAHVEPVTQRENIMRGEVGQRLYCNNGHERQGPGRCALCKEAHLSRRVKRERARRHLSYGTDLVLTRHGRYATVHRSRCGTFTRWADLAKREPIDEFVLGPFVRACELCGPDEPLDRLKEWAS